MRKHACPCVIGLTLFGALARQKRACPLWRFNASANSYKSALFLMHRIRFAMKDDSPQKPKLFGTLECDETFCDSRPVTKDHGNKIIKTHWNSANKIPVVAMVRRGGEIRTGIVPSVTSKNLSQFLNKNVTKGSTVNTDQWHAYKSALRPLVRFGDGKHLTVNHGRKEYARTNPDGSVAHVNTCESFFSLLKRGLMGTFHCVPANTCTVTAMSFHFVGTRAS